MKFTFKKQPKDTGLAGVGNPYPSTDIKLDKKNVGIIAAPNWTTKDGKWEVCFMRETEGGWNWINFKQRFDSEPAARDYIQQNAERILTLKLHSEEPD